MNERTFVNEIAKAKIFQSKNSNPDYWMGYERGLQRQYYGRGFGTEAQHLKWLLGEGDPRQRQRSKGYRDGLCVD
ncbi:MAG: hypothetical protein WBG37_01745 [Desulfobacterales bacterium]